VTSHTSDWVNNVLSEVSGHLAGSLKSFTIIFNNDGEYNRVSLPSETLSTLSPLGNLEHLDISGIPIFYLDNALSKLTPPWSPLWPWPKIQSLHFALIDNPFNNSNPHSLQLSTLQRVAQSCPNLTSFQGLITIPEHQSAAARFTGDVLSHQLASLSVGSIGRLLLNKDYGIDKLYHVARLLYAMFPNLQNIQTHEGYAPVFWNEVHKLVKLCQDAREIDYQRTLANSLQDGA
jgi:hypothetical protein